MNEFIMEDIKTLFIIVSIILITHTLFFMAYGYIMSGDPFIAVMNFYDSIYNIRW